MKVFSITGTTGTGKTSVVEKLIAEFCSRGFSVGSVKEIHNEQFQIDTEGKNTWRHRQAGARTVTALGYRETDVLYPGKMSIYDVLKHYDQDIVALEGVTDAVVPNIVCCKEDNIPAINPLTIAVSGRYANTHEGDCQGLPVFNVMTDVQKLADLVLDKMPELMYDIDPKCCSLCGYDCRTFLSKCLKGEETMDQCVLRHKGVSLKVDGEELVMVPFVQSILKNVILGVVKELRGYKQGGKIEIAFTETSDKVFESKKNKVFLNNEGVIVKEFAKSSSCDTEESMLRQLDGNHAPKLLMRKDNTLYIEYIEGTLLVDEYIHAEPAKAEKLAASLARAVKEIYALTGKITFDENFRNYIIKDGEITRIDLEETTDGTLADWCAKLMAFASLYDAPDASKHIFLKTLANALDMDGSILRAQYEKELNSLSNRWKVPFPAKIFDTMS